MQDVMYLGIIVGFFALAVLFVAACDRIIGSDEEALIDAPDEVVDIRTRAA
jgi:hypothetical protein